MHIPNSEFSSWAGDTYVTRGYSLEEWRKMTNGLKVEIDLKAPLASPILTGTPTAPTAAVDTNTTQLATTAFVRRDFVKKSGDTMTGALVSTNTAKAWVNFNGTGTVAIRASYNVSSITDLGTGYYRVNFSVPFANNNYSAVASRSHTSSTNITNDGMILFVTDYQQSSVTIYCGQDGGNATDVVFVSLVVFSN